MEGLSLFPDNCDWEILGVDGGDVVLTDIMGCVVKVENFDGDEEDAFSTVIATRGEISWELLSLKQYNSKSRDNRLEELAKSPHSFSPKLNIKSLV